MDAISLSTPRSAGSALTGRVGPSSRVDRDGWWKSSMRASPNPGSYSTSTWTDQLPECTMVFKASGRDKHFIRSPQPVGTFTQPGLYETKDALQEMMRKPRTYSFRGISRDTWGPHVVGRADKHLNLAPGMYEEPRPRTTQARSAVFISSSARLPTPYEQTHVHTRHVFTAVPPPTSYPRSGSLGADKSASNASGSFGSTTQRFSPTRKAVSAKLGPGYYEGPTPLTPRTALPSAMPTALPTARSALPTPRAKSAPLPK